VLRKITLLLAGCSALALSNIAIAVEVQPLFKSGTDVMGNPVTYPDGSKAELTGDIVTMHPGDTNGWHRHDVPTFGYVLAGELTVDYANGSRRVYRAGDSVIEAQHMPHKGHNLGSADVRIVVFYAGAPGVPVSAAAEPPRPDDFVAVRTVIPDVRVELRYFGSNNFIGRPIDGYEADAMYLTQPAAAALRAVQADLAKEGLGVKVFDAYRPQRAVDDFMRWAADPADTKMKSAYYPDLDKSVLIPQGYIAERSGHSRGSTVDLTLITLDNGEEMYMELDMGSPFDFFDPVSWPSSDLVTPVQHANRMKLREVMLRHGFKPLNEEWWHFTLADEPYPDRFFDFPIR